MLDTITVHKSGLISGIGRYTELPFEADDLARFNLNHPDEAIEKEFQCTRSGEANA